MLSMGNGMAAREPNMVVLFADDSGYADFGFQEHARSIFKNLTPHIDGIAKAGARLRYIRHSRSLLAFSSRDDDGAISRAFRA